MSKRDKADTPIDVSNSPTVSDPIAATPNGIGIKRPQYMLDQPRKTGRGVHNKPGVEIWAGSAFGKVDCCPDEISKQAPCWDGYVQRGMKPGANGKPVPNCVPVEKAEENPVMPTSTYQGCECKTCKELNVDCMDCPNCKKTDSELGMAMYDSSLGKQIFNLGSAKELITKQTVRWSD